MPFGAEVVPGGVRFRIFAPAAERMSLLLQGHPQPLALHRTDDGWHELIVPEAHAGSRYRYQLPDGTQVPDPASRFQPEDVTGPSEVIDPAAFAWTDGAWRGRPWSQAVLYELHIGTFTPEGTFRAATERLDYLQWLGVTAIEVMAINDFAGTRGWGYDGVLPHAPDSAYGRPDDVKAFIDAAHARGLQVIFDVVYNHFGPDGNYISRYFPQICSEGHDTAWGKAMNFDGDGNAEVRAFFLHNALYWIEEFHADGLRIDASHAMIDTSPKHILDEMAEQVRACAAGREVHLILEDEANASGRLGRSSDGTTPLYTAQWNHDMTHLLSASMGNIAPDRDSQSDETHKTATMLAEGYVLTPTAQQQPEDIRCKVPPTAYIAFLQTHDLIGNRIAAERLDRLVSKEALRAVSSILLLLPQTPMLFMGQEWMASQPFPFFCDYQGELAGKIRDGREDSLRKMHSTDDLSGATDPGAESTFLSAKLNWDQLGHEPHASELAWYRNILGVRRNRTAPLLADLHERCGRTFVLGPGAFTIAWPFAGNTLTLSANLTWSEHSGFPTGGETIWLEGWQPAEDQLGAWSVRWSLL
jgi:malto-oligosyltrehalose trehalohydrolase